MVDHIAALEVVANGSKTIAAMVVARRQALVDDMVAMAFVVICRN